MPRRTIRIDQATVAEVAPALAQIRAELDTPGPFAPDALAEAEQAAADVVLPDRDATDLELVTIDPPGARDLDQAVHLARAGDGFVVHYAIADPASFVTPGGPLDQAVHERGMTFYGPDGRIGLHPDVLAEGAASLLPDQVRPACLWTIRLDARGEIVEAGVERARVRSRAQLTYEQVQTALDGGAPEPGATTVPAMLDLLRDIGSLRQQLELERGGASLSIPEQEIVEEDGRYRLRYRATLDVEDWNAQISLLTGIAAAALMRRTRVGVLRTLPEADPRDVKRLRRTAHALGIDWPHEEPYGRMLHGLDASIPAHAAFLEEATTLFRGAGYLTFDGELPPSSPHGAIAAEYAHVTAPLRRLVDRYGLEICLAATARTEVPGWVREGLDPLPKLMASAGQRSSAYERACVDLLEAVLLATRVGETFDAVVVEIDERRRGDDRRDENGEDADGGAQRGTVVIAEPAVRARVTGTALPLGEQTTVRLTAADPATRTVTFGYPA